MIGGRDWGKQNKNKVAQMLRAAYQPLTGPLLIGFVMWLAWGYAHLSLRSPVVLQLGWYAILFALQVYLLYIFDEKRRGLLALIFSSGVAELAYVGTMIVFSLPLYLITSVGAGTYVWFYRLLVLVPISCLAGLVFKIFLPLWAYSTQTDVQSALYKALEMMLEGAKTYLGMIFFFFPLVFIHSGITACISHDVISGKGATYLAVFSALCSLVWHLLSTSIGIVFYKASKKSYT